MTPPPTDRARALANMLDQLHANACGKHHAKVHKDVCAVVEKFARDTEAEVRERMANIAACKCGTGILGCRCGACVAAAAIREAKP